MTNSDGITFQQKPSTNPNKKMPRSSQGPMVMLIHTGSRTLISQSPRTDKAWHFGLEGSKGVLCHVEGAAEQIVSRNNMDKSRLVQLE